jgi:dolichol-phosphate mannosyltransferase
LRSTGQELVLNPKKPKIGDTPMCLLSCLVIVPTYNERENVLKLIPEVMRFLKPDENKNHILVVDDNSPDGTSAALEAIMYSMTNLHIIKRPGKMGLGTAYLEGFRWGLSHLKPDVFIHMDADLSHPPHHLIRLVRSIGEGFDVVIASRYVKGGRIANWPWNRRIISRGANTLARLFLGIRVVDVTSGYRALSRRAVESLLAFKLRSKDYGYLLESLYFLSKNGFKVKEIPFTFEDRRIGKTKLSSRETLGYAYNLLRLATFRRTWDRLT